MESCFEVLENLNHLRLWHIKKEENCLFLGNLKQLKRLELTWSSLIKNLHGIDSYSLLEGIALRNLGKLENVTALIELKLLKGIWLEGCKNINEEGKEIIKRINGEK